MALWQCEAVTATRTTRKPRPPVMLDALVDDPEHIRELVRANAPYWPVQRYINNSAEYAALSGDRRAARGDTADSGQSDAMFVAPVFRGNWALQGETLAGTSGEVGELLHHPLLVSAAAELFERAGCGERGSITAFYTVLVEDDEVADPIAEEVRSLLDGHIVLSRKLAAQGQYPSIDVLESTSRVMNRIVSEDHDGAARFLRQLLSAWRENEILIRLGEYRPGGDPLLDEAVAKIDGIQEFLGETGGFDMMLDRLFELAAPPGEDDTSAADDSPADDPGDS